MQKTRQVVLDPANSRPINTTPFSVTLITGNRWRCLTQTRLTTLCSPWAPGCLTVSCPPLSPVYSHTSFIAERSNQLGGDAKMAAHFVPQSWWPRGYFALWKLVWSVMLRLGSPFKRDWKAVPVAVWGDRRGVERLREAHPEAVRESDCLVWHVSDASMTPELWQRRHTAGGAVCVQRKTKLQVPVMRLIRVSIYKAGQCWVDVAWMVDGYERIVTNAIDITPLSKGLTMRRSTQIEQSTFMPDIDFRNFTWTSFAWML